MCLAYVSWPHDSNTQQRLTGLKWVCLTAGFQLDQVAKHTSCLDHQARDVEYSLDDKSLGNYAPGCQKCVSLPCIILGAEMDMESGPSVPLSVRHLDGTTNQTRPGRLAAHLISVLYLPGTFSSQ